MTFVSLAQRLLELILYILFYYLNLSLAQRLLETIILYLTYVYFKYSIAPTEIISTLKLSNISLSAEPLGAKFVLLSPFIDLFGLCPLPAAVLFYHLPFYLCAYF